MYKLSLFRALLVAIAASASSLSTWAPAIAQSSQPFTGQINNVLPTLFESNSSDAFPSTLPSSLPSQQSSLPIFVDSPVFVDENSPLSSPNIDVYNANSGVQVILIDPVEQSYLNAWEHTVTTQLSDINIQSAVQAPITQIRIRAGRPEIERLGRNTTDSLFFNTTPANTISNFPTRNRLREFSDLPDGNYRVLLSSSGIGDGGVVRDGRLFTFRKLGETVTGNFDYIDSGESACVSGTLQGNTVFGEAFTDSAGVRVLDRNYLGSGLSLQLSDRAEDSSAVLNLNGFSLVNAGTIAPPTACR